MTAFIELSLGEDSAVISETGAALLSYTVGGRPVVVAMEAFDGAVLAPWPNRIAGGRFEFDGRSHQLPISEPELNTALHGLVAHREWTVSEHAEHSVTLTTDINPEEGYPFHFGLTVTYTLQEETISVAALARNLGNDRAPFGFGFHPWIHPGADTVDEAQLVIPAQTWFPVDEHLIPTQERPFDDGTVIPADHEADESACIVCKDFRALRILGDTCLDDAFGSPRPGRDGWSWARLKGADDRTVVIGMDSAFRAWQACSGDELGHGLSRSAIAIEPMTCPPNAFAAGSDFDVIDPGQTLEALWSIGLH